MDIEPCLVLGNLVGDEIHIATHSPYREKYSLVIRNLIALDTSPMVIFYMTIYRCLVCS